MTPPKNKSPEPRHHGSKEERESVKYYKQRNCLGCGKTFFAMSRFIFTCGCIG